MQGQPRLPLRPQREDHYACAPKKLNLSVDSTGFSEHRFDERWPRALQKRRGYLKAHIACYDDCLVPSVRPMGPHASDMKRLIPLVRRTGRIRGRRGTEAPATVIRADGAYTSRMNVQFIHDIGAIPYLRPRRDAIG